MDHGRRLSIGQCIQLSGEWRERDEEDGGGRMSPGYCATYQERFGADA